MARPKVMPSERDLVEQIAERKTKKVAEDSPDFKWYRDGDRKASLPVARLQPPPQGTSYRYAGKGGPRGKTQLVKAVPARAEDDAINPKTGAPYHMNERFRGPQPKPSGYNKAAKQAVQKRYGK